MKNRFLSLDGWRGLSIILVLLGHLFPLGPKLWGMNGAIAATGMSIFFILSGFLILNVLINEKNVTNFLIKRFFRILPISWLVISITFIFINSDKKIYLSHFLFYANWAPMTLTAQTSHFWSLCVEVQFYIGIAFLFLIAGTRIVLALPIISIIITLYRYLNHAEIDINTFYRIDELLAGCILAIINMNFEKIKEIIGRLSFIYLFPLLILSAHPAGGVLNYFRPYIAMLMIGSTLFYEKSTEQWLKNKFLCYMASVSYAVYIVHGGLRYTWLGTGETGEKYIKRILLLIVVILLAHLSTFYYEKYWINLGKKLCALCNSIKNGKKIISLSNIEIVPPKL